MVIIMFDPNISVAATPANGTPLPQPFDYGVLKWTLIGVVAAAALAVGSYYASMEWYKVWNPFDLSVEAQQGLTIAGSCVLGLLGIGYTSYATYNYGYQPKEDPNSLKKKV